MFVEQLRGRMFALVAEAYSVIAADEFAALVGLERAQAVAEASRLGWAVDAAAATVKPKPPAVSEAQRQTSLGNIRSLCDYVVHLDTQ